MKKIISLLLAIAIFIPAAASAQIDNDMEIKQDEVISGTMQRKIDILSSADILRGYSDGSFQLNRNITRAEFAVLCVRALGYENNAVNAENVRGIFTDTEGHWAIENIELAESLGLFTGSGGKFYPDNNITGYEAVKVVVCMLGYKSIADANGGWPNGYMKAAAEIGLFKEIECEYKIAEAVTREFVISLMFRAMELPLVSIEFENDSVKYTNDGDSMLERIHHIYNTEGRITATKYTDLYRAQQGTHNNAVIVDGEEYFPGTTDAHNMIGYYVEIYYHMEDKHSDKTLLYIAPQKKSSEIEVNAGAVEALRDGKLYFEEEGKSRKASLEKSLIVFYNKRAYPDYTAADFQINNGSIKLLDSDGNGIYEAAFITEYRDIVLGNRSAETKKLIDYFNPSISVELEPAHAGDDVIYSVTRNGEQCDYEKLAKYDVLSVYESKDGCVIDIIAVNSSFEGTIKSRRTENGKTYVEADDTEYLLGVNCSDDFVIGGLYVIYINHMREIAGMELKSASTRFAYLMRVAENDNEDDSLILKILDSDGKIKKMKTVSKVKIDGKVKKSAAEIRIALKRDDNYASIDNYYKALLAMDNEEAYDYAQLIMIKSNSNDEITQIMTEKPYNNHLSYEQRQNNPSALGFTEEELCDLELGYDGVARHDLDKVGSGYDTPGIYFTTNRVINNKNYIRYTTGMNSIEGKIALTDSTKFFILNTDVYADAKYSVSTGSAFSDGEQISQGNIQIYNMNKANEAMAVVLVRGADTDVNYPLFLVDRIDRGINNDDEPCLIIRGLYNGETVSYPCKENKFAMDKNGNMFERGDVIRVSVSDNEITASEMMADASDIKLSRSSPAGLDTSQYYDVGKIYNIGDKNITMAFGTSAGEYVNRRTYTIDGSIYIYDKAKGKVYIGSSADIEDYANYKNSDAVACVYLNYGKMKQLVYYKPEA